MLTAIHIVTTALSLSATAVEVRHQIPAVSPLLPFRASNGVVFAHAPGYAGVTKSGLVVGLRGADGRRAGAVLPLPRAEVAPAVALACRELRRAVNARLRAVRGGEA